MKFFLLIGVKMPTIVGILTLTSRTNSILDLSEPANTWISWYFYTYEHLKFHSQLSWARKMFYNLGPWRRYHKTLEYGQIWPLMTSPVYALIFTFLVYTYLLKKSYSTPSKRNFFYTAVQRIHMKHQALFSSKDKSKKLKCRLLHFCLALWGLNNLRVSHL